MRNSVVMLLIALLVVTIAVPDTFAQNKRTGTAAASELLIPVGARDLALSGSTLSSSTGIEAIYWNPAGVGRITRSTEAMFSYSTYIADIGVNYGAVAAPFGSFGVLAFSVKSISLGDISLTTNEDPEGLTGRVFSPTFITLGVTYAKNITDAIAVGANIKLISNTIDRVSSSGVAFDVGVQYNRLVGIKGFNVGVAIKNIGGGMKFDGTGLYQLATPVEGYRPSQRFKVEAATFDLPSLMEIGLGYDGKFKDKMSYSVNASFTNDNLYVDQYRFGAEVGYMVAPEITLFGRGGYEYLPDVATEDLIWGPTFGVGIDYLTESFALTVDYAYRTAQYFDGQQVIAVKLGF